MGVRYRDFQSRLAKSHPVKHADETICENYVARGLAVLETFKLLWNTDPGGHVNKVKGGNYIRTSGTFLF